MDFSQHYGSGQILKDSVKLLFRNKKIITLSTIFPFIFLNFTIFFCNAILSKSIESDLSVIGALYSISPTGAEIANALVLNEVIFRILDGAQITCVLAHSFLSFYTFTGTITIMAATFHGNEDENNLISAKDMILKIAKSWFRPLFTWFHLTIFGIGYIVMVLAILLRTPTPQAIYIVLFFLAFLYYIHLSVVWALALVISVIEQQSYWIEALGEAGRHVKGKRLLGFVTNFLFLVVSVIFYWIFSLTSATAGQLYRVIIGLLLVVFLVMLKMLQFIVYTVIYLNSKKVYAEEIGGKGIVMEYDKSTAIPLIGESLP